MFSVDRFNKKLETAWLGRHFIYHESVDSTNTFVKQLAADQALHGLVCLADYQTKGRGQYKRSWYSEPDVNLTFSVVFRPDINERLHALGMVAAFTLAEILDGYASKCINIRWPNDLYYDGKKMAGLLIESIFNGNKLERFIIGIGLNVNQKEFETSLRNAVTSLIHVNDGNEICRENLLANILEKLETNYNDWEKNDQELVRKINRKLIGYGKKACLRLDGEKMNESCKILGINEQGHLTVLDENMSIITYTHQQVRIEDVA